MLARARCSQTKLERLRLEQQLREHVLQRTELERQALEFGMQVLPPPPPCHPSLSKVFCKRTILVQLDKAPCGVDGRSTLRRRHPSWQRR